MRQEHVQQTVFAKAPREAEHSIGDVDDEATSSVNGEPLRPHQRYPRST
jgi:hypothetical protein